MPKSIRTIRAIHSPADDIRIEANSMFAAQPSVNLKITRHGVPETNFTIYELEELAAAISDIKYEQKYLQKI